MGTVCHWWLLVLLVWDQLTSSGWKHERGSLEELCSSCCDWKTERKYCLFDCIMQNMIEPAAVWPWMAPQYRLWMLWNRISPIWVWPGADLLNIWILGWWVEWMGVNLGFSWVACLCGHFKTGLDGVGWARLSRKYIFGWKYIIGLVLGRNKWPLCGRRWLSGQEKINIAIWTPPPPNFAIQYSQHMLYTFHIYLLIFRNSNLVVSKFLFNFIHFTPFRPEPDLSNFENV